MELQKNVNFFKFSNFSFVKNYRFKSGGNTFEVLSEDLSGLTNNKNLRLFPFHQLKYSFLFWLNKKYNSYRIEHGKEYFSLIKWFSNTIPKDIVINQLLNEYKLNLIDLSVKKECQGIICSHQACSGIYHFGGATFLNSGYWTETLTALAESNYGRWEIINFEKIVNEAIEAMHHSDVMEELFEAEKNMIT